MYNNSVKLRITLLGIALVTGVTARAGEKSTVTGWVIDSACTYTKNLTKPIGAECAKKCATAGSPLVILADDGIIYLPIDKVLPASSQNRKLIKFAGERVTVRGEVFTHGGSKAIAIEEIQAPK